MAGRKKMATPPGPLQLPVPTRLFAEGAADAVQSEAMRRVEAGLLQLAEHLSAPLGMDRRRFLQRSCGMAAAFLALNAVFGPIFAVAPAEAADPETAAERENLKLGDLLQPIRVALTGSTVSEPVNELLEVVGRPAALARLGAAGQASQLIADS